MSEKITTTVYEPKKGDGDMNTNIIKTGLRLLDKAANGIKEFVENGGIGEISEKIDDTFNRWGENIAENVEAGTHRLSDEEIEEYCSIDELTATAIKSFRAKEANSVVIANAEEMLKDNTMSCAQNVVFERILEKYPDAVLMGLIAPSGELKKFNFAKNCDDRVYTVLSKNGGKVIID